MAELSTVYVGTLIFVCLWAVSHCQSYQNECTAIEKHQRNCLNGGECFVLQLEEREPFCRCPRRYTGRRCQDLNMTLLFGQSTLPVNRTVLYLIMIGGVLGGLVIGVILTLCVSTCYRRRRQRQADNGHPNGHVVVYTAVPTNQTENIVDHV